MTEGDKGKLNADEFISNQNQFQEQSLKSLDWDNKTQKFTEDVINLLNSPVTALPFDTQVKIILGWASSYASKFVCVANVHMLMEAYWYPELSSVLKNADLVTPDGMPLVWMMRLMGVGKQDRVAGMDILLSLCQLASLQNIRIFFLGSEVTILEKMKTKLEHEFPELQIAGMESLPFRPLTSAEDEEIIQRIHQSKAQVVLVSLGCPKQEYWMNEHKSRIQAVMVGLGGVFPVFAGIHKRPPLWVRSAGLEWFYRLIQEPRRLGSRYGKTIPPFIWLSLKQVLTAKYYSYKSHS